MVSEYVLQNLVIVTEAFVSLCAVFVFSVTHWLADTGASTLLEKGLIIFPSLPDLPDYLENTEWGASLAEFPCPL